MNRRESFRAMNAKVIVLLKRDLNYKLKLVSNENWEKKVWIFLGLSIRGNPDRTRLTSSSFADPLWFASRFWWLLFSLFSEALRISYPRCPSLYICFFTYAFSCSLPLSSRCILPILASFLIFLRVFSTCFTPFTSCFLWSLCLFLSSLFHLTPSLRNVVGRAC